MPFAAQYSQSNIVTLLSLAIMEMRVLLARLFWNFDMTSEDGAPLWDPRGEMRYKQAFMVWEKSVVNVKLRNRKATGA